MKIVELGQWDWMERSLQDIFFFFNEIAILIVKVMFIYFKGKKMFQENPTI